MNHAISEQLLELLVLKSIYFVVIAIHCVKQTQADIELERKVCLKVKIASKQHVSLSLENRNRKFENH